MNYKVYTLSVEFKNLGVKKHDFFSLRAALEMAYELKDSPIVNHVKLKTEWRGIPEWQKQITQVG